ncbi:unnamed protein product [Chrysoparadoxa australica]
MTAGPQKPKHPPVDPFTPLVVVRGPQELQHLYDDRTGLGDSVQDLISSLQDGVQMEEKKKPISDIPVPIILEVETYSKEQVHEYKPPPHYVRYPKRAGPEDYSTNEYALEKEDWEWRETHRMWGDNGSQKGKLTDIQMERIIDILEKLSAGPTPVPAHQADPLFMAHLNMTRAEHGQAWNDVYMYWKAKRARLGKALLRRFWPTTSPNDTDPHKVFRPREKERYKLRRNRRNDIDSFKKMQMLKRDFDKVLSVLHLVARRERLKRESLLLQEDLFKQAMYDLTDTSGRPCPLRVKQGHYKIKLRIPSSALGASGISAHHRAALAQAKDWGALDRERAKKYKKKKKDRDGDDDAAGSKLPVPVLPSFMDPLPTRQEYDMPSTAVMPSLPTYYSCGESAVLEPIRKFQCRGRVGRGGRVVFDRVPVRGPSEKIRDNCLVVYNASVMCPFSPPSVSLLQQPSQALQVNHKQFADICNMEDDQEELIGRSSLFELHGPPGVGTVKYCIDA